MFTVGNKTIKCEVIEHYLGKSDWDSATLQVAACFVSLLVFSLNGSIVKFILLQKRKTFLDWIIVIDVWVCLWYIPVLALLVSDASNNEIICLIQIGISFFISILNRLLTILVVIYRTIYILKPHLVDTLIKRKYVSTFLLGFSICLCIGLTVGMGIYREKYLSFKGKNKAWHRYIEKIKKKMIPKW